MAVEPREFKPRKDNLRRRRKEEDPEEKAVAIEDFHLLQCPACEKHVKVHKAFAGHQMGCSFCKAPLEIIEAEPEPEDPKTRKKRHGKPVERQPLAFRILKEEDIAEGSDLEFADEYERRRLPFEAPKWDDENEVSDRKGKKLLTRNEYVFRTITMVIMSASMVVLAVILYSAFFRGVKVVKKDHDLLDGLPAEVRAKIDAVLAAEKPISAYLTSDEEEAAVAIVNGFVNAKSIEERLPYLRQPERVEPLMRDWYAREDAVVEWPDGKALLRDKIIDGDRFFVRLAIDFGGLGTRLFAVEQTKEGFFLDWETAVEYQQMPYEEFRAKKPQEPVAMRVKVKVSDYYNFEFADKAKYRAVELSYPGDMDFKLVGYVERSQPWAAGMLEDLERGYAPSMVLKLRYLSANPLDESQVEIVGAVAKSWFL